MYIFVYWTCKLDASFTWGNNWGKGNLCTNKMSHIEGNKYYSLSSISIYGEKREWSYCSFIISNINSGKVSFELCFSFKVLCRLFILKLLPYKPLWNKDQWTTELAIKGSLILNITHVWTRGFFSLIGLVLINNNDTVEPWHNKVLGVTHNFLYPSNSKIYGKEPWYDSPLPPQHIEVPLLHRSFLAYGQLFLYI